jgi:hypothetical protein
MGVRLDSVFADDDGLPVPRYGITPDCPQTATPPRVESEIAYGQTTG